MTMLGRCARCTVLVLASQTASPFMGNSGKDSAFSFSPAFSSRVFSLCSALSWVSSLSTFSAPAGTCVSHGHARVAALGQTGPQAPDSTAPSLMAEWCCRIAGKHYSQSAMEGSTLRKPVNDVCTGPGWGGLYVIGLGTDRRVGAVKGAAKVPGLKTRSPCQLD